MTDTVLTYKGRPITDLTKNELVDAMTCVFQEIECLRERADRLLNAAALAEPEPQRRRLYSPVQIAECGGRCEQGPNIATVVSYA